MSQINPLRYRGYYFDSETQLYYLQSRYYDPTICRFINADAYASTGQGVLGHNMFAYCVNSPSNTADSAGYCCMFLGLRIFDCKNASCPDSKSYMDTSGKTPGTTMGKTINGQDKLPYSDKRIGLGTYGANGCGLIAVYNAMQLIGKNVTLQDVTYVLRNHMLFWGLGGLKPSGLDFYFTVHNIEYTQISSMSSLSASVEDGNVFVFVVMNNKKNIFEGFHTMAGQYINGEYRIYNRYNGRTSYATYASLKDGFREELWIYGILLEP